MQIIIPRHQHNDIEDYAAFRGFYDAITNSYSKSLFNLNSEAARSCRAIYELAYEFEKLTNAFENTCEFEIIAIVRDFNDLKGWGSLYSDQLQGLLPFSYREFTDEGFIEEGTKVVARLKYSENYKIQVLKITRAS